MTTTATQAEATTQVQSALDDAVGALPAGAKLEEILLPGFPTSKCDETSEVNPSGLVFVNNSWWLRGVPVSANADAFTALRNHWTSTGWTIDTDQSPSFLNAKRAGYGISVGANSKNELTVSASSPCVTPTPAP